MQNKFINYLFFQWQTQQKPMSQKIGVFFKHKKKRYYLLGSIAFYFLAVTIRYFNIHLH